MKKEQTNITMHLHFDFENKVDFVVVEKDIKQILGIENIEFETTKDGQQYFKCAEVKMETRVSEDVINEFLSIFNGSAEKLNLVCDKYKGTYFLDIIPWIKKGFLPGIVFEKHFLEFLNKIKNFEGIGIDMYMY